jgi:hypothetical protein
MALTRRGSPEWDAAVKDALDHATAAGRIPAEPPPELINRVADLIMLKERERERERAARRPRRSRSGSVTNSRD